MTVSYGVYIDLTRDKDFNDTDENVSAYMIEMEWQLGGTDWEEMLARNSTLRLLLWNGDNRFSPEHASGLSGFSRGALIKVDTTYSATTRQMWIGRIREIRPSTGQYGPRTCEVRAVGYFADLQEAEVAIPVQFNKRSDELIDTIITTYGHYPADRNSGNWGDLDVEEVPLFAVAGDNWGDGVNIRSALHDIAEAHRGYIYENRLGQVCFIERGFWNKDYVTAVDRTVTDADVLAGTTEYRFQDGFANWTEVECRARSVGTTTTVLGSTDRAVLLKAGEWTNTSLRYDDGSGNRVGGKDVITPAAGTDWNAYDNEEGTGSNLNSNVTPNMTDEGTRAQLNFWNAHERNLWLRDLQIRGKKITDYGRMTRGANDPTSIANDGVHKRTYRLSLLDNINFAQDIAYWMGIMHRYLQGEVRSISYLLTGADASLTTWGLSAEIGDRIRYTETQTGGNWPYYIIGERHKVRAGGEHIVTHYLRPGPYVNWLLGTSGYSALDQQTYLGL